MSGTNEDVEFNLKVMINKQKTKVLFAEIDSDFADVLISFLTMPLGTIVRVLKKHYGEDQETRVNIGSLTTLYDGLSNLDIDHFGTVGCKKILLNSRSSFEAECCKLKIDIIRHSSAVSYLSCEDWNCKYRRSKISTANITGTCRCGKSLNREVGFLEESEVGGDGTAEVFATKKTTFLISDNLRMVPSVAVSIMQTLTNLGITDTGGAELRTVTFEFNEIMDLLKGSLLSRTPLSDIILEKGRVVDFGGTQNSELGVILNKMKNEETSNPKKMILRLMVQKSNNKLLFAQAGDDFVDFLFSFLTIPIGGVECLLGGKTRLKSIDNLYNSIADIDDKYMATRDMRNRITDPKLPRGYISANQILPLSEQTLVYYHQDFNNKKEWFSYSGRGGGQIHDMLFIKGGGNYVKQGLTMYTVSDDLTVTPLCMTSSLSILNEMKIPLSDVKEVEVQIGVEEALSILKASLTSTSALTDSLMNNSMLKKQPKQEH
ncbi:hypothetical protein MIMGU_mgv1a018806mg [Erythranthe guttata]|uniref:DUF674 domain-containing protein n=1 Tax=Erythranthe guttata TaxID=4155 RepID=A0A022R225_ERYGU|nr:PREDICTED: uncharacterized protein LOC105961713 [Erythranthe guttata]EYU33994.1 hypothetical protein MIMGU_mgv1a018806mg [Erythranthe guttata]|eukprot:XP_012841422.1 PREDICTED: uncharacterized protein LOC105961713 [Erythranthe guttata]